MFALNNVNLTTIRNTTQSRFRKSLHLGLPCMLASCWINFTIVCTLHGAHIVRVKSIETSPPDDTHGNWDHSRCCRVKCCTGLKPIPTGTRMQVVLLLYTEGMFWPFSGQHDAWVYCHTAVTQKSHHNIPRCYAQNSTRKWLQHLCLSSSFQTRIYFLSGFTIVSSFHLITLVFCLSTTQRLPSAAGRPLG